MRFFIRLRSALYCLLYGYAAVPLSSYNTVCVSDESLLLTSSEKKKSVEVAMWALERPEHYWRATTLGKEVHEQAVTTMGLSKVED